MGGLIIMPVKEPNSRMKGAITRRRGMTALLTFLFIAGGMLNAYAQSKYILEYRIKAAFIYKFIKFVEWPTTVYGDDQEPLLVGVLGEDPFKGLLEKTFKGKKINGRELLVKRSQDLKDLGECHVIFISQSEKDRLGQILDTVQFDSILTVGDMEGFASSGGMIGIELKGKKIVLEINTGSAEKAGLEISSKLLVLAKVIK